MRIAYLILAHNNPNHVRQLLRALASVKSACFVHIDKKSTVDFGQIVSLDRVQMLKQRVNVYWGDFSIVQATLSLIRAALADARYFDRMVLLSGADYPVRPISYVESFFQKNIEREFINVVEMPSSTANKPLTRLNQYYAAGNESLFKKKFRKLLDSLRLISLERDFAAVFKELRPYAGSQWWALSRQACEYIERFCLLRPEVVNFFRNTLIPDEMFFQTILANSAFQKNISRNLTYSDWSNGGASPAFLSGKHVNLFATRPYFERSDLYGTGEILFARKFSDDTQPIIHSINKLIWNRNTVLREHEH